MMAEFTVGLTTLAAWIAIVLVLARVSQAPPVAVYFGSALAVHFASIAAAAAMRDSFSYWHAAAPFWFGFMAYLFVFGAIYKSISLKMLRELWVAPGHALTRQQLAQDVVLECFTSRIDILVAGGLVDATPDGYQITDKGRHIAGRIAKVQALFGITSCGLYDH